MSEILVPVSFGELLDKIAILQIKSERMTDPAKLANVRKELSALEHTWMQHPAAGCAIHVCSSADSSLRTLASLASSFMRSDLICRIAILSSSSPKDTGTWISDMDLASLRDPGL